MGFIPSFGSYRNPIKIGGRGRLCPNQLLNLSSRPELPKRDNLYSLSGIQSFLGKKSTMIIKFQRPTLKFDTGLPSRKASKNTNDHEQWGEIVFEKEDSYLLSTVLLIIFHKKVVKTQISKGKSTIPWMDRKALAIQPKFYLFSEICVKRIRVNQGVGVYKRMYCKF